MRPVARGDAAAGRGAPSACAAFAVVLCAALAEAKGSAAGARSALAVGGGSRSASSRAFIPYGVGYYYVGGRAHSPGYGGYQRSPGWAGAITGLNESCGDGTCPCPVPNEAKTRYWVWVQTKLPKALCNGGTSCSSQQYDVTTFEVDAFIDIASRVPCTPPTQVLALKNCRLTSASLVTGGLADDQLLSSSTCTTVGDEVSVHYRARLRRLLQTAQFHVLQFVVGAESSAHADSLHTHIRAALSPSSTLGATYNLSSGAVLSVETGDNNGSAAGSWLIPVVCAGGALLVCACICFVFRDLIKRALSSGDDDGAAKEPATEAPMRECEPYSASAPLDQSSLASPATDVGGTGPSPARCLSPEPLVPVLGIAVPAERAADGDMETENGSGDPRV